MNVGIGKAFTGAFVASAALAVALIVAHEASDYKTAGTFRTGDLIVGTSSTTGAGLVGNDQASVLINSTLEPVEIDHSGTNSQCVNVNITGDDIVPTQTQERQGINVRVTGSVSTINGAVTAMPIQATIQTTKSAGASLLTNVAVQASAQGGDDNLSFEGLHGTLRNNEGSLLKGTNSIETVIVPTGGINVSATGEPVSLNNTVRSFGMIDTSPTVSTQISMNVPINSQPYMIAAKPNVIASIDAFFLALDTTVNAAARGGFIVSRGAGGFGASVEGGIAVAAASGFPFVGMAANDYGVFAEGGGDLYLGADNSTFIAALKVKSSDNTVDVLNGSLKLQGTTLLSGAAPAGVNHGALGARSTNLSGTVTTIGANTSVVLTYSAAFPNGSNCTVSPLNASVVTEQIYPAAIAASVTFSCFAVSSGLPANCDDFSYICAGN